MKKAIISIVLVLAISFQGCSADNVAQTAVNVIQGVINIAQVETSAVPAADQTSYKSYLSLLQTLNTQLASCNAAVSTVSLSRSSKFLACFQAFSAGATSPAELAQLRVLSPGTQGRVQAYITAVVIGVNAALVYFGGAKVGTPAIAQ